ncbi:unnamed protein product [Cylicostephanus goldi]|uniref:Peptidoglycan binding-like domain-containing protein n=1 Tax=Cylicostephanus goldi TaxID=71465 RepID=A0A3P6SGP0_CYLGO|nr:unnamed protein product [Cylicostephanus goldi]
MTKLVVVQYSFSNPIAESQLTSDAVSDALKRFQRMFGLPQTGEMDEATSKLMSKKRCGVKDVQRT